MKKIPKEVYSYVSSIQQIKILPNQILLYSDSLLYSFCSSSIREDIYSYLKQIDFLDYYPFINKVDEQFSLFCIDSDISFQELSLFKQLYEKSAKTVSFTDDKIQKIEYKIRFQLRSLLQYYYGMQEQIEEMLYPRNFFYQLIVNISSIYSLLNLGLYFLDQWVHCNPLSYQEVLTVRRVDSANYLGGKIIDFSKAKRDYYVYELANYYLDHYQDKSVLDDLDSFFLSIEDRYIFYALISIVWKMDQDTMDDVSALLNYVQKTNSYLLQKYQEDQKIEKDVFTE